MYGVFSRMSARMRSFSGLRAALSAFFGLGLLLAAGSQDALSLTKVGHIRTEYFDIYYAASLSAQAERLAGFADAALDELAGLFGLPQRGKSKGGNSPETDGKAKTAFPGGRIALLLSDVSFDLNGYSTTYPSNRIVIYLAAAGASGQLASLDDELRSVFIHELTHAVTLNLRGPFWAALAAAAGDFVTPVSWIAPSAFVEGSAVWAESREPRAGRLNDPAALEAVYQDIAAGRRRGLWELSGVADFPGSGDLPYLYGALFARFMQERYGSESLKALWGMASRGNIFAGFDGTLLTRGALGRYAGMPPAALWNEFLDWLESRAERPDSEPDATLGAAGGRVGAFCADKNRLYFLDADKKAVFALELPASAAVWKTAAPKRLFAADGYLEDMRLSADGRALELDWIRKDSHGRIIPARYAYSFETGALRLLGDREVEKAGEAAANLVSASMPFVYNPRDDAVSGYRYGLVRLGSRRAAARVSPEGSMEILDAPLRFIHSLTLEPAPILGESPFIALGAAFPGGLSRIALLSDSPQGLKLYLQKKAPAGGAALPLALSRDVVVYRAELGEGRRELRAASIGAEALASSFDLVDAAWLPLETVRKKLAGEAASPESPGAPAEGEGPGGAAPPAPPQLLPHQEKTFLTLRPVLFPRIFATSRYPYASLQSAGLFFDAQDITRRLSWRASAGWNFLASVPEASLALGLAVDEHNFSLAAADSTEAGAGFSVPIRVMSAAAAHLFNRRFVPVYRQAWVKTTASFAGLQGSYSIADYASPLFDYLSAGARMEIGYSSMRSRLFAPFDEQGITVNAGADYEILSETISGLSFSGSASFALARPAALLSLYGAISPNEELLFLPTRRSFSASGLAHPSALAPPYPAFKEYGAVSQGSPWYLYGELAARLFSLELWDKMPPVPMPFLPSWTIRRMSLWLGARAALLDQGGAPVLPSSAFMRLKTDAAVLAGLAAQSHLILQLEASWAFDSALAGGKSFYFDFSLGVAL